MGQGNESRGSKEIMKIAFVYHHKYPNLWRDGLWAALKVLEDVWEIEYVNLYEGTEIPECDFVLGWGAFGSPSDLALRDIPTKKGLCIAGNAIPPNDTAINYDILFHETNWYSPVISFHPRIKKAFGINTDIYHQQELPKIIDVLSVGSFSSWKRQELMTLEDGVRLVVGEIQIDNFQESLTIIGNLVSNGVGIMDMVPPESLGILYNMSKMVYIPANIIGGGERAVWEARACGVDVKVENDNPKLKELLYSEVLDHFAYAQSLREGIMEAKGELS